MIFSKLISPFLIFIGFLLLCITATAQITALTNMRLLDVKHDTVHTDWIVLIEGQEILEAGSQVTVPPGAEVIDLTGKTLSPGFIDMHVHFWSMDKPQYEVFSKLWVAGGVTTVFSLGDIFPEDLQDFRKQVNAGEHIAPTIFTVGPYFNGGAASDRFRTVNTIEEALDFYNQWKDYTEGIKFYVQISEECFDAVIEVAQQDDKIVTGHLMSITTEHAIDQGINGLEHGIWTVEELISQTDDPSQFTKIANIDMQDPKLERIIDKIVKKGVYISPTITPMETFLAQDRPFVPNWQVYLADSSRSKYKTSVFRDQKVIKSLFAKQREFVQRVHQKGGLIVTGTDPFYPNVPPGYAMHREIIALTECGLSNMEALKAATLNGALALRKEQQVGSIEAGKVANMVIIAGNPDEHIHEVANVVTVINKGEFYNTAQLRSESIGKIRF